MATQPNTYHTGAIASSSGLQTGANLVRYPFLNNPTPDPYTKITQTSLVQLPANYSPLAGTLLGYGTLSKYSEAFTNGYWTPAAVTPADNVLANPSTGTTTAGTITETSATAAHYLISSAITIGANFTLCGSVFVKAGTSSLIQLDINDGSNGFYANFNLSTGTIAKAVTAIGTGTATSAGIYPAGNGWYRVYIVGKAAAAATSVNIVLISINSAGATPAPSYAGNTANYYSVFGAQLEVNATSPGPYISVTGATRNISSPNYQPLVDPFAYLVEESEMQLDQLQRANYLRYFARIPADQIIPSSRIITRPVMHATAYGTNYGVSFDSGYTSTIFANPNAATRGTTPPGGASYRLVQPSHGGVLGDAYAAWGASKLLAVGFVTNVPNTNAWDFHVADMIGGANPNAIDHADFQKSAFIRYVNGPVNCTIKKTQKYYLPGVTANITTFADIPTPSPNMDPVSWMKALFDGSTYTTESVSELTSWHGPILVQEINDVQMADAKDTVNVVA